MCYLLDGDVMLYLGKLVETCKDPGLAAILTIVKKALDLIQIIGPIIALISLSLILIKLIASPDNKKLKNAFRNWLIAFLMLFFIPTIINVTMNLFDDNFSFSSCWDYVDANKQEGEATYNNDKDKKPNNGFLVDPDDYDAGKTGE